MNRPPWLLAGPVVLALSLSPLPASADQPASTSTSTSTSTAASAATAGAQTPTQDAAYADPGYLNIKALLSERRGERKAAQQALLDRGDPALAFGIVDALFFIPKLLRREAFETLEGLTGVEAGDSHWDWVEVMGELGERVRPAPGYVAWKAILYSQIDEGYRDILVPGAPSRIRLEEVVSGGVRIEGIPSLDDPPMVRSAAKDSRIKYLRDGEAIFGVDVGGEQRAYPLRFLDWHEMLNDTIAGRAITLSYCTLCGSGVLFATDPSDGAGEPFRFATSGLLYRSNKLMFDRGTRTLWSNLTGKPVLGELVGKHPGLELLPHTRTTWGEWKARHPETLVVALDDELEAWGRRFGFDYRPGVADRARRGVRFPVWKKSQALEEREEIYALRIGGAVKAYTVERLLEDGVINDVVGDQPVVLVADAKSGAVRAYTRGETLEHHGDDLLRDAQGTLWRVAEGALERHDSPPKDPSAAVPTSYQRLPGHFAYWFGWYAFFPQTEVYGVESSAGSGPKG